VRGLSALTMPLSQSISVPYTSKARILKSRSFIIGFALIFLSENFIIAINPEQIANKHWFSSPSNQIVKMIIKF
jgi:hypothetical protein